MDFVNYLKQFEEGCQQAETKEPGEFSTLPDGKYKATVDKVYLNENKYTELPQLTWEFRVLEGDYEGRKIFKHSGLDNQDRVNWMKQDLRNCGLLLASITTLEQELPNLLDKTLLLNLKSKEAKNGNVYQNTYIVKEIVNVKAFDVPF